MLNCQPIFKEVKILQVIFLSMLINACRDEQPAEKLNTLKFYTARAIDSIVQIIDSKASEWISKNDTAFSNFISSNSKQHKKDLAFEDSSVRMIYYREKCGLYCSWLRKFYFKNNQLIKVSFSALESLSIKNQGAYYYSREKAFLMTTSNRRLPKPETALEQAKKYLRRQ